jgi:uncharacterized membrane-anchored protein
MKPQLQRLCLLVVDSFLMVIGIVLIQSHTGTIIPYVAQAFGILFLIFAIPSGFMIIRGYFRYYRKHGELI